MGYQIGVDLGTTFSAAAVSRDNRAAIVPLGTNTAAIPSVVLVQEDGSVLTGDAAVRRAPSEPQRVVREFKRRLGDSTPIIVGGAPYPAEVLTARLLESVISAIQASEGGPHEIAAIAHPANWGQYKVDLFGQAIQLAGLDPRAVKLITEPEAAAISYAMQERSEPGEVYAVYDLGGGTFDAAVLRRTADGFDILGQPEGIERLGGIDFDAAVLAHVTSALGESLHELDANDSGVMTAVSRLRLECVAAKEALSIDTDAVVPILLPNHQSEIRITRGEFEGLIRPTLVDTIEAMRRAITSAGLEVSDMSRVLLVGGSSRIPLVGQMVASELGRPVAVDAHPKHSIALGTALAAAGVLKRAEPDPFSPLATVAAPVPPILARPPGEPPTEISAEVPTEVSRPAAAQAPNQPATHVSREVSAEALQGFAPPPAAFAAGAALGSLDGPTSGVDPNSHRGVLSPESAPVTGGHVQAVASQRWEQPSKSAPSRTGRRALIGALVGLLLLAVGGTAWALSGDDSREGAASSSAKVAETDLDGDGDIDADDDAMLEELEAGSINDPDGTGGIDGTDENGDPASPTTGGSNATNTPTTARPSVSSSSPGSSTGSSTPTTSGAVKIQITSAPKVNTVENRAFQFDYLTNDVCGDGSFTVREKSSGTVVGSFSGNNGCNGPRHGGYPGKSGGVFSNFDIKPGTTYTVSVTVKGTASDGTRTAGTGTASRSFEVTTSGTAPTTPTTGTTTPTTPSTAVAIAIVSGPTVNVRQATAFQFDYNTNDVCGDGSFVVREKSSGTVVGSFSGNNGCNGPRHGGFPGAPGVFGGFALQADTVYTVTVTVKGTASNGGRPAGSGSASRSFEVRTAA